MFVKCTKLVRFVHPDNPKTKWEMPAGFIGDVPSWVEKHWYFDALCKDGTITKVQSKRDKDLQDAVEKKAAEEEQRRQEEAQKAAENAGDQGDAAEPKKGNGGKK